MPRPRKEEQTKKPTFAGFERPESNWFKMPTTWTDITAGIDNLAELKVVEYILRHTWGYQEYGIKKHITIHEFVHGRHHRDGSRMDKGTGLSERSVYYGLARAVEDGLIEEEIDDSDLGRIKKKYGLRMMAVPTEKPALQDLQSGVQSLHPPLQNLQARGAKPTPRTEKEPLERTQHNVVVVEALRNFGVSAPVATMLAGKYPEGLIFQKLELVQWLMETQSPLVTKNPAGYLRRAIEEDYAPPRGYKTRVQRGAEEEGRRQVVLASQEERLRSEAELAEAKEEAQRRLRDQYPPQRIDGTDLTTEGAWELVLDRLKGQMTKANFETWLKDTSLIYLDGSMARVAAASKFQIEWLVSRFDLWICRELSSVIERPISCEYLPVSELLSADRPDESIGRG